MVMTLQRGVWGPVEAFTGFLDDVSNVEHVYLLLRALSSYTGNLVRLRRDSDDAEADFTYVSDADEGLDVAAITTWLGGATPYIVTTCDQAPAGDDISQATAGNQPELTLSDATINNKPTFTHAPPRYLQGPYTNGGIMNQPNTFYFAVKNDDATNLTRVFIDGDQSNRRNALYRVVSGANNLWRIYADTSLNGGNSDTSWNIWTGLFNLTSSQFWLNGVSEATGNAGNDVVDGITIGASYTGTAFTGRLVGIIVVDGNSSDADKNIVGQKFDGYYGISYTDI